MTPQLLAYEMTDLEQRALAGADTEFQRVHGHPCFWEGPVEAEYLGVLRRVHRIFAAVAVVEGRWAA